LAFSDKHRYRFPGTTENAGVENAAHAFLASPIPSPPQTSNDDSITSTDNTATKPISWNQDKWQVLQ